MRKTSLALFSASISLCALLAIETRTFVVAAKATYAARVTETDSLVPLDPTPQNDHFIWLSADGDQSRSGYQRVIGGKHRDGTTMYICRVSGLTPGKLYNNSCHYSYVGQEYAIPSRYEVLLTNVEYEWRSFDELRRTEIKRGAVVGGSDANGKDTLYMCRRHMSDGWHPGKYSYRNNLCYIPWGNQEKFYGRDFEILFPSQ